MLKHQEEFNPQKLRILFYIAFLLSLVSALFAYLRSSYIERFISLKNLGFIFVLIYFITFLAINNLSRIIKKYGKYRTLLILLISNTIVLFLLTIFQEYWLGFLFSIFHLIVLWVIWIVHDIFVEKYSIDTITGKIRGLEYTIINLGWIISPFLAGVLFEKYGFPFIFLILAFLTFLATLSFGFTFKKDRSEEYFFTYRFFSLLKEVYFRQKSIFKVLCISFLLEFFYSWMVIYTPLHLRTLGMSWSEIGTAFTIMLLAFLLFQYPAGWLADKYLGEKELISSGFIIMALITSILFFVDSPSFTIWAILLFLTRIGAALVEILSVSYFFKQIDRRDINLVILFRNILPLAYIVSSSIAVFVLYFFPLKFLFLFLALFMSSGLLFSLTLKDTK